MIGVLWVPIAAEIFLRWLAPIPILPRFIEAGPHGVRVNSPERTYRHKTPEYTVEIRTNSAGLRSDQEYDREKPEGVYRIAVLGDSFGMGYGVDIEDSSLFQLEKGLEELSQCEVETLNFSVSGFGPGEEMIVLEEEALAYQPDLVIQYFTRDDPWDDMRSNLFELGPEGLGRAAPEYLPAVEIREFLFSYPAYRWLASESHLYSLLREEAGRKTKEILSKIRGIRSAFGSAEATRKAASDARGSDSARRELLTLTILDRMRSMAGARDADFLILSIPIRKARAVFEDGFPSEDPFDLPVVSPIPGFEKARGEMLYWERSHGHWTPLGCSLVAETLVDAIVERELLPASCGVEGRRPESRVGALER